MSKRTVIAKEGATFDAGDILKCECGDEQPISGYVLAHWGIPLFRNCSCGRHITVEGGLVTLVLPPSKPVS